MQQATALKESALIENGLNTSGRKAPILWNVRHRHFTAIDINAIDIDAIDITAINIAAIDME